LSEKKAVSEAIERISCSIINKDIHTFLKSKSSGMDISEIYADKVELKKHEETIYYTWLDPVFGKNGKCLICTELLYYPYDGLLKSKIVNSNGVATHTTKRDAVE
jgi:ribosomal protein S12 methylthiotransferase accessory factor YcaO